MTTVWPPKDPGETILYTADFTDRLSDDTIDSYTASISSGDVTISNRVMGATTIQFLLAGGTAATTSVLSLAVTTKAGQIFLADYSVYVGTGETAFRTTSATKQQLVDAAYNDVALNGWELDITPEEKDTALTRLDTLMWELFGRGLDLGYNFPTGIGAGNLSDDLGVPDQAFNGLSILLARKLCPTMGKKLSQESREAVDDGMKAVRSAAINPVPFMQLPKGTPLGSGGKPWTTRYPFAM